jgi:hypothetical protein
MKKLIVLILAIVVGLLAFNYFTTGELKLLPGAFSGSGGGGVTQLREDFRQAVSQIRQAGRSAGATGLDTTDDVGDAFAEIDRIEKEARRMARGAASEDERKDAESLLKEIARFRRSQH